MTLTGVVKPALINIHTQMGTAGNCALSRIDWVSHATIGRNR